MDLEQPLYFEGQANSLSFPAPRSLLPNVRDYPRYTKWRVCWQTRNAKISIIVRDSCIVIIMALSIPSVSIAPMQRHLSIADTYFDFRHLR